MCPVRCGGQATDDSAQQGHGPGRAAPRRVIPPGRTFLASERSARVERDADVLVVLTGTGAVSRARDGRPVEQRSHQEAGAHGGRDQDDPPDEPGQSVGRRRRRSPRRGRGSGWPGGTSHAETTSFHRER
ncbi:hypothetical protein DKT69_24545 [Micromonospora sicca]|uniref:Uncharacterized protein n=1 Tax=Micromonospora sicca TaxID=2202420 RepID=A0A317DCU5_9ACTN|nr:hypothetical protein DKT69_24545 [Micromonospora sp. 4G51]